MPMQHEFSRKWIIYKWQKAQAIIKTHLALTCSIGISNHHTTPNGAKQMSGQLPWNNQAALLATWQMTLPTDYWHWHVMFQLWIQQISFDLQQMTCSTRNNYLTAGWPVPIHQWSLEQLLHTEFATLSWNAIWIKLLSYHEWAKRSMQPVVEDSESRTWWTMWHSCQFDGPHEAEMNDNRSGCWEPASQQACRSHLCLTKPICRPWWAWQTVSKQ